MGNEKIAVAAVGLIVVLAAAYILLSPKSMPDLSVEFTFSPQAPYAGDVVEFTITVANMGTATASGAITDLEIGGVSVAQKQLTLAPGESQEIKLYWLASHEGETEIRVNANKGNIVEEADSGNSIHSIGISVLPSEEVRIFENLPDMNITKAYEFHLTRAGMTQLVGILASAGGENTEIYRSLSGKFGEAHLAIAHYSNGSELAFMHTKPELIKEGVISVFETVSGEFLGNFTEINKSVAGRDITAITSADGLVTICTWQEKGWAKSLLYKRYFHEIQIGNLTIGDDTSCEDLVGMKFNPASAEEKLRSVADLSAAVSLDDPLLMEARAKPDADALYVLGFYDENSAYILTVSTKLSPAQDPCLGELIQQDNRSVCHVDTASILGKVDAEGFIRRQGGVVIAAFIIPFQSTDMDAARAKALETVKSVVYEGIPEYDWSGQGQAQITTCRFASDLWCTPPVVQNGTVTMNITHAQGHPFSLSGFRCTQLTEEPSYSIALPEQIHVPANETLEFSFKCYVTETEPFGGDIWFLRGYLYANYTDTETNETRMVKGNILINSPPGAG